MERNTTLHKENRPSMMDVARLAGLSKTTVSYVLNNNPRVTEDTKARVLEACERLGYRINTNIQDFVRSTISQTTRNIALVFVGRDFADPAYARLVDGIAKGTEENNYHLLFAKLSGEESGVMDLPPILRDGRVDGMLISGVLNPGVMNVLRALEIPGVILGSYSHDITRDFFAVECDMGAGIHRVIEHFAKLGKTRIAYFSETLDYYSDRQNLLSFKDALLAYGLKFDQGSVYVGSGDFSGALQIMTPIFEGQELPFDALYCNDFRCSVEISHLAMARSWMNKEPSIILGTTRTFAYHKLPVPAVYLDTVSWEVSYQASIKLLDSISQGERYHPGSLRLSPTIDVDAVPVIKA